MRETFIPVATLALMDRLTHKQAWTTGKASEVKRFFRYLCYWRQQQYQTDIMYLKHAYEPFNPDSDLLTTRRFTNDELIAMRSRVVDGVRHLLIQANYRKIERRELDVILASDSHYGLDFRVDLDVFEELEIYFRGASQKKDQRRSLRTFLRKEEFNVPIFQRLFILFKLKTEERLVDDYVCTKSVTRKKAAKILRSRGKHGSEDISRKLIYMKLFKNMPQSDVEMIFPNTRIKFRLFDKIKLGITGSGAVGMGLFGTLSNIVTSGAALITNPVAVAGMLSALGGVLFRQIMDFFNTRQRYMVVMAQNLYFHSLADNRGVMIKLADRAADEDVKEEILLYSVLAKREIRKEDLQIVDEAVEQYLKDAFGLKVDFDVEDALGRLITDGIVIEEPSGILRALPPAEAAAHIDNKWDVFLDNLPDGLDLEGVEFERRAGDSV
ncbi:MAG: DUF3754 domain-containing protein, partial [Hyphomicrobiaceae bacterium]|nr:DUF3754 domain-containing protein [Hyphomicrobiaceae bacterium]